MDRWFQQTETQPPVTILIIIFKHKKGLILINNTSWIETFEYQRNRVRLKLIKVQETEDRPNSDPVFGKYKMLHNWSGGGLDHVT